MADAANQNQDTNNNSILVLQGNKELQDIWSKRIEDRRKALTEDQAERKQVYKVRNDFVIGNQTKYTNIVGLQQKEKQGHANSVINYAGKTIVKIAYALSNNPPKLDFPVTGYTVDDPAYMTEEIRTQAVEEFTYEVFRRNKFWLRGYRRGVFNQVKAGDYAIKVYPQNLGTLEKPIWEIKIVNHEKMENLLVGWRGDDSREFDYVIAEELRSIQSVEDEFGIKVDKDDITNDDVQASGMNSSGHANNGQWGVRTLGTSTVSLVPSGKNTIPSVWVREYDDENVYAIKIGKTLRQLVFKDGKTMPSMKFWVIGENIPNTGSHWSISDVDYLIDPQIELNEASNEERDYIRVGANQKYVAYNMDDFDPKSVKTGSGGVIFVNSADGTAKFEPLQTNVNSFPAESYLTRMKKHIHDMGIPDVSFGGSNGESGRKGAVDYQTIVDLVDFKQDSWELSIMEICEKIQVLGSFYFNYDFFDDPRTNNLSIRYPDFNWADIVPITQSDKIVNVVNKVQMGLPYRQAFKELGYRDVDGMIAMMKAEGQDSDLMVYRAKMWNLTPGLIEAQIAMRQNMPPIPLPNPPKIDVRVQADADTPAGQAILEDAHIPDQTTPAMAPTPGAPGMSGNPAVNTAGPTMVPSQNAGRPSSMPISQRGGTTAVTTGKGVIDQATQNLQAQQPR